MSKILEIDTYVCMYIIFYKQMYYADFSYKVTNMRQVAIYACISTC